MGTPFFGNEWEGRVVEGKFPLLEWRGGSDCSGSFFTVLGGLQQATIHLLLASDAEADVHLAQWNFATGLSHPHIAKVLAAGHCAIDGTELVYAVTESSDANLSRIIRNGTLGPARAREVFVPVLAALSYLHQHGVVHGHINPSTIQFACARPKLSIADLVLAGSAKRSITVAGLYDAPEAHTQGVTPASDVWSIAMTMYEAITDAQLSFNSSTEDRAHSLQSLPSPFREILQDCLQPDPHRRCTVRDILEKIEEGKDAQASATEILLPAQTVPIVAAPFLHASDTPPAVDPIVSVPMETAIDEPVILSKSFARLEKSHLVGFRVMPFAAVFLFVLALVSVLVVRGHSSTHKPEPKLRAAAPIVSQPVAIEPSPAPVQEASAAVIPPASPTPTVVVRPTLQDEPHVAETPHGTETPIAPQGRSLHASINQPLRKLPAASHALTNAATNGSVVKRILPNVAPAAFDGNPVLVEVQVRVAVDQNGAVSNVESVSPSLGNYFARLADRAARSWQFKPPTENGRAKGSVWTLRFYFSENQTEATAEREQKLGPAANLVSSRVLD